MPAVANIVLNDALGTPVAHTFVPLGPDPQGVWWFEDQSATSPAGYNRISLSLIRAPQVGNGTSSSNRVNRFKARLYKPTLETISNSTVSGILPAPVVGYVLLATIDLTLSERSTLQERKDLRKFTQFLMADALVTAMTENLTNVF